MRRACLFLLVFCFFAVGRESFSYVHFLKAPPTSPFLYYLTSEGENPSELHAYSLDKQTTKDLGYRSPYAVAMSADGSWVLAMKVDKGDDPRTSQYDLIRPETGKQIALEKGIIPQELLPNGEAFIFSKGNVLSVFNFKTEKATAIYTSEYDIGHLVSGVLLVSPDSKWIALRVHNDGEREVHFFPVAGGPHKVLPRDEETDLGVFEANSTGFLFRFIQKRDNHDPHEEGINRYDLKTGAISKIFSTKVGFAQAGLGFVSSLKNGWVIFSSNGKQKTVLNTATKKKFVFDCVQDLSPVPAGFFPEDEPPFYEFPLVEVSNTHFATLCGTSSTGEFKLVPYDGTKVHTLPLPLFGGGRKVAVVPKVNKLVYLTDDDTISVDTKTLKVEKLFPRSPEKLHPMESFVVDSMNRVWQESLSPKNRYELSFVDLAKGGKPTIATRAAWKERGAQLAILGGGKFITANKVNRDDSREIWVYDIAKNVMDLVQAD